MAQADVRRAPLKKSRGDHLKTSSPVVVIRTSRDISEITVILSLDEDTSKLISCVFSWNSWPHSYASCKSRCIRVAERFDISGLHYGLLSGLPLWQTPLSCTEKSAIITQGCHVVFFFFFLQPWGVAIRCGNQLELWRKMQNCQCEKWQSWRTFPSLLVSHRCGAYATL